jgi:hypothetical protein
MARGPNRVASKDTHIEDPEIVEAHIRGLQIVVPRTRDPQSAVLPIRGLQIRGRLM